MMRRGGGRGPNKNGGRGKGGGGGGGGRGGGRGGGGGSSRGGGGSGRGGGGGGGGGGRGGRGGGGPGGPPGRGGAPAHLRGKEIGLWHASRGRGTAQNAAVQRDKAERPMITMGADRMAELFRLSRDLEALNAERVEAGLDQAPALPPMPKEAEEAEAEEEGVGKTDDGDVDLSELISGGGIATGGADEKYFSKGRLQPDPAQEKRIQADWASAQQKPRYKELHKVRQKLPIYKERGAIEAMVEESQVCLVSGETGSGKSTQVPQFLLEKELKRGKGSSTFVVVTQPRRISATSLAARVADERGEGQGRAQGSVGYLIRLEGQRPRERGAILFCTTGILVKWLLSDPSLSRVSHIVLDEIHERDLLSDFLMILLKDLLPRRPELKLVLMSATLNAALFSDYFWKCPSIDVPGRRFDVQTHFLEDVIEKLKYKPLRMPRKVPIPAAFATLPSKAEQKEAADQYFKELEESLRTIAKKRLHSKETLDLVYAWDESQLDFDLIVKLVCYINLNSPTTEAILIFLPGWTDISKLCGMLVQAMGRTATPGIVPLHSLLPSIDQKRVFASPPPNVRKIVVATNIAETSITVEDVVHVIDAGKIKMTKFDVATNMQTLRPEWISQANGEQRRGRAGRVREGQCFHLMSSYRWSTLDRFLEPEMRRTRVESLILEIKQMRLGKARKFLGKALEPPSERAVTLALEELVAIGALSEDSGEDLTPLGTHLARLPLDPHCGKMILHACLFSCLDPVLTVAACLDYKDPFNTPMGKEQLVDAKKRDLAGEKCLSDYFLWAQTLNEVRHVDLNNPHGLGYFTREHFINLGTVKMLEKMKSQFAGMLRRSGFLRTSNPRDEDANQNSDSQEVVDAVICAGLYPKIAMSCPLANREGRGALKFEVNPKWEWPRPEVHPKSIVADKRHIPSRIVAFQKVMRSSKVYLYDCGAVSPLALVLTAGSLKYAKEGGESVVVLDGWVKFYATADVVGALTEARAALEGMLRRRVSRPIPIASRAHHEQDPNSVELGFLYALADLLNNEHITLKR